MLKHNTVKPPQDRIATLRDHLMRGVVLSLADRMVALWFINEIEGWPDLDPGEVRSWEEIAKNAQ